MPLDVTVGGASAEAYLSIAEGDAFASSDLGRFATAWRDASVETKEAAVRRATREIDAFVGVTPEEAYYYGVQALAFPRTVDVDVSGTVIVPSRVKRANYLQAAYLLAAADTIDEAALRRAKGFSGYTNPDGTGGQVATDSRQGRMHPEAEALLGGFDSGVISATIVPR